MRTMVEIMTHMTNASKSATKLARRFAPRDSFAVGSIQTIWTELTNQTPEAIAAYVAEHPISMSDKAMLREAWKIAAKSVKIPTQDKMTQDKTVKLPILVNGRPNAAFYNMVNSGF